MKGLQGIGKVRRGLVIIFSLQHIRKITATMSLAFIIHQCFAGQQYFVLQKKRLVTTCGSLLFFQYKTAMIICSYYQHKNHYTITKMCSFHISFFGTPLFKNNILIGPSSNFVVTIISKVGYMIWVSTASGQIFHMWHRVTKKNADAAGPGDLGGTAPPKTTILQYLQKKSYSI